MAKPAETQASVLDDREHALRLFRQMALIRRFEERTEEQYTRARIGGYCHLAIGEEAPSVGRHRRARGGRLRCIASYRDHGTALAVGSPAAAVMAELFGKDTGVAHGRGGSMHLLDVERHFYGGWGIVGAPPADRRRRRAWRWSTATSRTPSCASSATARSPPASFHEALNLAVALGASDRLPGDQQPVRHGHVGGPVATPSRSSSGAAAAYRMHGEQVDGNDVLAVREAADRLLRQAREERRPALLETITYRYRGHSVADAGKVYRTARGDAVVARARSDHPLRPAAGRARARRADDIDEIWQEVSAEVKDAIDRALAASFPPRESLYEHLYGDPGCARAVRAHGGRRPLRRARRGADMADVTYREALRLALDEELGRDPTCS